MNMMTVAKKVESLISELKFERENLGSRLDLGSTEVKKRWTESEEKWEELERKHQRLGHSVGKATIMLGKDLEQISGDLKQRYQQIHQGLN
jgi:hypothetical protein